MKYRLPLISIFGVLGGIVVAGRCKAKVATTVLPPNHQELTINGGGLRRNCVVHVPTAYDKAKPIPLVIMLHGFGGTGANAVRETGWSAKADAETFIIAYPDATRPDTTKPQSFRDNPQAWNSGSEGRFYAEQHNIDDVAFIKSLIDRLKADYNIDTRRIFVTGFSNGASMAIRIGAELSDRIAAVGVGAGTCLTEKVKLTHGVSLCYITGTADTLNPLEGGRMKNALGKEDQKNPPKPPVRVSIERWIAAIGCPKTPTQDETKNGVRTRRYGLGRDNSEIVFITVEGLGHIWAGGVNLLPEFLVGKPTNKLKATDVLWDFFKMHPAK
jgi:polyhydroxybutyrate depolymerase